jgi:hypothetical protein
MQTTVILLMAVAVSAWAMWVALRDRSKDREPK